MLKQFNKYIYLGVLTIIISLFSYIVKTKAELKALQSKNNTFEKALKNPQVKIIEKERIIKIPQTKTITKIVYKDNIIVSSTTTHIKDGLQISDKNLQEIKDSLPLLNKLDEMELSKPIKFDKLHLFAIFSEYGNKDHFASQTNYGLGLGLKPLKTLTIGIKYNDLAKYGLFLVYNF